MPILNNVTKMAVKPLPRMISPRAHAIVDYITMGAFFASSAWLWRSSKRVAVAALLCGVADLTISLLTDYPGGVKKFISFSTHRDIDFALATMTATMPEFLAFENEAEKRIFLTQGALMAGITELTEAGPQAERRAA